LSLSLSTYPGGGVSYLFDSLIFIAHLSWTVPFSPCSLYIFLCVPPLSGF
jgi:hypothetical protein